ncbi:MAG: hypothetical protein LC745_09950 [Planctomycetia bacterium]|nr:hypothetical protein [Planctomycetia bacterium]
MTEKAVLFLCRVPDLTAAVRQELQKLGKTRLDCFESIDRALKDSEPEDYSLILIHWNRSEGRNPVDELLWLGSTARRRIPIIVLSDHYDQADALTFFRIGVTDYLSLHDHRTSLGAIVEHHGVPRPFSNASPFAGLVERVTVGSRSRALSRIS